MIALAIAAAALAALGFGMVRLFAGPTLYDRLLAANSTLVKASLVMAALAVAAGSPALLDVALVSLMGVAVVNVAVVKLFKAKSFQPPLASPNEGA